MKEIQIEDAPKYIENITYDNKYKDILNNGGRIFISDNATLTSTYYYLKDNDNFYTLLGPCSDYYFKDNFISDILSLLNNKIDKDIYFYASFYITRKCSKILRVFNDNTNKEEIYEDNNNIIISDEIKNKIELFDKKLETINAYFVDSNIKKESHISEGNYEEAKEENNYMENEYDEEYNIYYQVRRYIIKKNI